MNNDRFTTALAPWLLVIFRLILAYSFFKAGYLKIINWSGTLYLFEYEYQVPILPFELAAYMATAVEIVVPIALVAGFFTRFNAAALFMFNAVAVYSYPALWQQGFYDHRYWAAMLAVLILWGAGKFSVDSWQISRSGSLGRIDSLR